MTVHDPQPRIKDPNHASDSSDSQERPMYRTLNIPAYNIATAEVRQFAIKINKAIEENPNDPVIDGKPFGAFLMSVVSPKVSREDFEWLNSARRLERPPVPGETDDELDPAEQRKIDNMMDGAGFDASWAYGRPVPVVAKFGARAVREGTKKRRPPGSVTPILESADPHLPPVGVQSDETVAKWRELFPKPPTRLEQIRAQLDRREDERLAAITGRPLKGESDVAREMMGASEAQEPELIQAWGRDDEPDLKLAFAHTGFYPKNREDLKLVKSMINSHFQQIPAWQTFNQLSDMVKDADKETKRQAILREIDKFVAILDSGIMGVRYADDLIAELKAQKEFGMKDSASLEEMFPLEELLPAEHGIEGVAEDKGPKNPLLADQLLRVARFHEADMLVKGTPVKETYDAGETLPQYVKRVLGETNPQTLKKIIVAFSNSERNMFEYGRAFLEQAKIHAAVRADVLDKIEAAENQVFWPR